MFCNNFRLSVEISCSLLLALFEQPVGRETHIVEPVTHSLCHSNNSLSPGQLYFAAMLSLVDVRKDKFVTDLGNYFRVFTGTKLSLSQALNMKWIFRCNLWLEWLILLCQFGRSNLVETVMVHDDMLDALAVILRVRALWKPDEISCKSLVTGKYLSLLHLLLLVAFGENQIIRLDKLFVNWVIKKLVLFVI